MSETNTKLCPPLTFRLYQSVRFDRPINKENDHISPGGYTLTMKDENGTEKSISFDFEDYEGSIDKDDPCILHCEQKNPDYASFDDLNSVTEYMLRNIIRADEWFIYTEAENENPLVPVRVTDIMFEIISDATGRDIPVIQIPVSLTIKPSGNEQNESQEDYPV